MACFTPVGEAGMRKGGFDTLEICSRDDDNLLGTSVVLSRRTICYQSLGSRGGEIAQFAHHCTQIA